MLPFNYLIPYFHHNSLSDIILYNSDSLNNSSSTNIDSVSQKNTSDSSLIRFDNIQKIENKNLILKSHINIKNIKGSGIYLINDSKIPQKWNAQKTDIFNYYLNNLSLSNSNNFKPKYCFNPSLKVLLFKDLKADASIGKNISFLEIGRLNNAKIFTNNFFLIIIIVGFFLIGLCRGFYKKYFVNTILALFDYNLTNSLYRDKNSILRRISLILNVLFFINSSMFLTILLFKTGKFLIDFRPIIYFIICFIMLSLIYYFRYLISNFIGVIFNIIDISKEYTYNILLINKNIGIYLLPLLIFLFYVRSIPEKIILFICLYIFSFFLLLRLIKGIQIIFHKRVSIYYTILYFCTLELLPFLWLYKLVVRLFV